LKSTALTTRPTLVYCSSGRDDIGVVKKLRSLRKLDLNKCEAFKKVPNMSHLTALAELNVDFIAVEEVPSKFVRC
jgi:hypothetical protein